MKKAERAKWMENKCEYNKDYVKNNTKPFTLRANKATDAELIEWLESKEKYSVYIKELILADMKKSR